MGSEKQKQEKPFSSVRWLKCVRSLFFRNFAINDGEVTPSRQKKETGFFCFVLDFS